MILVTGGTGFLGRNLLPFLVEQGYPVRVITRTPEDNRWLESLEVEVFKGDILDGEALHCAAEGCRYVIHGAGLFRFWGKRRDFEETNARGTRNVLEAARRAGVEKLVYVSTIAVAGHPRGEAVIDENHPPTPVDPYQQSKVDAENFILKYASEFDVPAVIARGGAFYGPHGRYAFNKLFFEDPLINHLPLGVDSGRHITFPAYIKDVARGLLLCLEKGRVGEIYNISSQSLPHREVERTIANLSGTSPFRIHAPGWVMIPFALVLTWLGNLIGREAHYVINMRPYIFGEWVVSIEKARKELGFQPTPFDVGALETLRWYADSGLWRPSGSLPDSDST